MSGSFSGGPLGFPLIIGFCGITLAFNEPKQDKTMTEDPVQGYKENIYIEYNPLYDFCNGYTYNNLVRVANLLQSCKDKKATTFEQKEGYGSFEVYGSFLDFLTTRSKMYSVATPDDFLEFFGHIKKSFKNFDHGLLPYEPDLESIKSYDADIRSFTIRLKFTVQYEKTIFTGDIDSRFKSDLEYNIKVDAYDIMNEADFLQQQNKMLFFLARALRHVQFIYLSEVEDSESSSLVFKDSVIEHIRWGGKTGHYKINSFADLEDAVIQIHQLVGSNCVPSRIRLVDGLAVAVKEEKPLTQPLLGASQQAAMTFSREPRYANTRDEKCESVISNYGICKTLRNCLQC